MRLITAVAVVVVLALVAGLLLFLKPDPPAEVSGQAITAAQLKTTPISVYTSAPPSICQGPCFSSDKNKLKVLIFNRWMRLEAKRLNIVVPSESVKTLYNANMDSWVRFKRGERPTRQAAYYSVLAALLSQRLPLNEAKVKELARNIAQKRPDVNSTPDTVYRNLRVVKTDNEADALEARVAIERGDPWSSVVRRYGMSRQTSANYNLTNSPSGSLGPEAEQALRTSTPGSLIGPVASSGYWWLIDYRSLSGSGPDRANLARNIIQQAGQEYRSALLPATLGRRFKRVTVCRNSLLNSFCSNQAR